jgi:hypothetical protein
MAAPLIRSRTPCLFSKSGVVVQAFMNGTDIEGGGVEWRNLSLAIDQGLATEARLDEAVRRSFKPHFDVGLLRVMISTIRTLRVTEIYLYVVRCRYRYL